MLFNIENDMKKKLVVNQVKTLSFTSSYNNLNLLAELDLPSKWILSVEEAGTNDDVVIDVNVLVIVVVV